MRDEIAIVEPGLAAGSWKTVCERQPGLVAFVAMHIQTNLRLALKALASDARELRNAGGQRAVNHVIDGFAEAGVVEAHAQRQFTEELNVRLALAERIDRLLR